MKKFEFSTSIFSKSWQNFRLLFFRWQWRFFIKKVLFRSKKDDFDLEKKRFWKTDFLPISISIFRKLGGTPNRKLTILDERLTIFGSKCLFSVWKARFWSGNTSNLKIHGFLPSFFGFSSSKFKCNSIETVIESDENLIIRKDSVAFEIIPIISEVIQCSKTKWS